MRQEPTWQGAAQFLKENSEENLNQQIDFLKTKEANFYGRFFTNCLTYEDFIERFRKLFNNSPQDIEVLKNFTSANVRKILTSTYGTHWVGASKDSFIDLDIEVKNPEPIEIKLKDKKIYDAIQIAQRFAAAMAHRLSPGGDLTGTTEFSEDPAMVSEGTSGEQDSAKRESILDELDDII